MATKLIVLSSSSTFASLAVGFGIPTFLAIPWFSSSSKPIFQNVTPDFLSPQALARISIWHQEKNWGIQITKRCFYPSWAKDMRRPEKPSNTRQRTTLGSNGVRSGFLPYFIIIFLNFSFLNLQIIYLLLPLVVNFLVFVLHTVDRLRNAPPLKDNYSPL